jgi:hypothetical protein
MDSSQERYIKNTFQIPGSKGDGEFLFKLYDALSYQDCIWNHTSSLKDTPRKQYFLEVLDPGCAVTNGCPVPSCEDTSCAVEENVCLTWCQYRSWISSTPVSQVLMAALCLTSCSRIACKRLYAIGMTACAMT